MSEVRGSGRECQAASAQERPRGATPCLRSGAMAETSYPTSEVRGGGTNYPTPKVRGGGMNYLMPKIRGDGLEELPHVRGQGRPDELPHARGRGGSLEELPHN